ncbi:MAG: ABC transporter substrate-binding protein [Thermomicrobiales bacterium]
MTGRTTDRSTPPQPVNRPNRRAVLGGVAAAMTAAGVARNGIASAQSSDDPIKIGAPYNLNGALASIDNPARDGSLLAVKQINAAGGVLGRQIELIVYDGKSDLTMVTNITKQLIEEDKVVALVGLTDTSYMLAAGQIAQEAERPFLDVGGTAPIITSVGDYIFMVPFGDNVQASAGAEFVVKQGWTSAALLYDSSNDYTNFLAAYFKARFTADDLAGQIIDESTYQPGDPEYSSQLTEFQNLEPQPAFLYVAAMPENIGSIVAQARDFGLEQPILGGDGYDTPLLVELAGDKSHDVYFTNHAGLLGGSPEGEAFVAAYQAEYNRAPESAFAALGFDGVKLMVDAIARAGNTEGAAIRDALQATQGFKGATGEISYQPGVRIPQKSVAIIEIVDEKQTLVEIVVPAVVAEE